MSFFVNLLVNNLSMETTIRIKNSELNSDFIDKIKVLFKNDEELEISISPVPDFGLSKNESRETYVKRIKHAINNLEKKDNIVSLSDTEFDALSNDLMESK